MTFTRQLADNTFKPSDYFCLSLASMLSVA